MAKRFFNPAIVAIALIHGTLAFASGVAAAAPVARAKPVAAAIATIAFARTVPD